jgi:hypothetical protein
MENWLLNWTSWILMNTHAEIDGVKYEDGAEWTTVMFELWKKNSDYGRELANKEQLSELNVTREQLNLIERALDFYSRVGIGQFERIKDHPTFEKVLYDKCTPKREPQVGDRTPQGEILEIKDGKALINGSVDPIEKIWVKTPEWKDLKDVKLSTDYGKYHEIRDIVDDKLTEPRNLLIGDESLSKYASFGLHNEQVDPSCRMAFDLIQVIRHERWKENPDKTHMTVDSHISFTYEKDNTSNLIRCKLNKKPKS